jgi:predicted Kef-type K+ transport protein
MNSTEILAYGIAILGTIMLVISIGLHFYLEKFDKFKKIN